jgi:hypothetical protein
VAGLAATNKFPVEEINSLLPKARSADWKTADRPGSCRRAADVLDDDPLAESFGQARRQHAAHDVDTAGRKRDRQGEGRYPMPPPEAPTRGADDLMPHRGMMRKSAAQHPSAATDQEEFP